MTREEKATQIQELTDTLTSNQYFYVTDASGMTVAEINDFRRKCFNKGIKYKVYKNTFIKKALDNLEGEYTELDQILKGYSGIMFTPETANLPAKVLKEFRKKNQKPILKAASLDSEIYIGDENLDTLSKLKSKEELLGEVISLLQSPAKNVISALKSSGGGTIAGLVKTLSEREN